MGEIRESEFHPEVTQKFADFNEQLSNIVVNANIFTSLQNAIDYCIDNNKILNVAGMTFSLSTGLVINSPIKITGDVSSTVLDFTAMSSGSAITIGNINSVNGLLIDGIKLIGTPNLTAFKLDGTNNRVITDSVFENMRVQNFGIGLKGSYSWCNLFENVRWQSCVKPLELGSQFNNTEFNRCSLVSSQQASTFTNCEGVNFSSPNIANVKGDALLLYQSNLTLINPYYEYIDGYLATVGQTSESYPSSFVSIGGKSTDNIVKIGLKGNNAVLSLTGLNPSSKFLVDGQTNGETHYKSTNNFNLDENPVDYVARWDGTTPTSFTNSYGGVVLTPNLTREKYTKVHNATSTGGYQLANLTVGESYTLIYRLRKETTANVTLRIGTLASGSIIVPNNNQPFETRYIPFTAEQDLLRLIWTSNTTLDIDFIGIVKGTVIPKELNKSQFLMATAPPTSGTWQRGDRVYNINPSTNGVEGWICTASGTPGVWESFGKIGVEVAA